MFWRLLLPAGVALAFLAAACGGSGEVGSGTEDDPRVVEVEALDTLAYDPATLEVGAGETVTFVVTNTGEIDHEFVVGDEEVQAMAEEEMARGCMATRLRWRALTLVPGEPEEVTITFEEAGTFEHACHVEGHYAGGMIGTISVS